VQLDERTLFFVMGLLTGLLAAVSWALRAGFGRQAAGVGPWVGALAAIAAVSLLLAVFESGVHFKVQNAFWVASIILTGYAVARFFGRAGRPWGWLASGVAVYAATALLLDTPPRAGLRIALLGAVNIVCALIGLRALWNGAPSRSEVGAVTMALGLLALIAASSYRSAGVLIDGAQSVRFFAGGSSAAVFQTLMIVGLLGITIGFMLLATDRLRRSVELLATHDMLTGLLNRRGFADRSGALLAGARRRGESVAMALLDLDDFKLVNDRHGHEVGDRLLADVGAALRDNAREQDVVARLGGEEFAVLMPDTGLDGAVRVAERLRQALAERLRVDGGSLRVTASVGLAVRIAPASVQSLYSAADRSLCAAKSAGKNRVAEPAS
jgi:diguanylate cyclase (GGDEF)-like protein